MRQAVRVPGRALVGAVLVSQHLHSAFCEHFPPLKLRWWLFFARGAIAHGAADDRLSHFDVLCDMLGGRCAEETEQLDHCFQRVYYGGARDPLHGWPCVCLRENTSAGEARGSKGGDGMSAILGLITDLERAADQLPLPWKATERIFEALGRDGVYRARMTYLRHCKGVRQVDLEHEPIDLETRRPKSMRLAEAWMAYVLGWRDRAATCRWPRRQQLQEAA